MRKLRRLAVFVEHYPPFLGSDRSIFELATRMAKNGVKVHFIVTQPIRYLFGQRPADWKYKDNWQKPPPSMHANITAKYLLVGRRLESVWHHLPPLAYFATLVLFLIGSLRETLRFRPDVVTVAHASPIVGVVAFLSARLTARRLIMGCPDWMAAYAAGLLDQSIGSLGPVFLQLVETTLYKLCDRVFTPTIFLRNLLVNYGVKPEQISVISNGVDPNLFTPYAENISEIRRKYRLESRKVVLFSGHLEEWAGVSFVYDLAKRLDKDSPGSTILLVGAGKSTTPLFERLVRDNLGHMVTYAGLQPFAEMPRFTAASDIALCIFPDTPVSHAASPLKLFEYMGAGLAIVASRVTGTAEVLDEKTGILIEPGQIESMCDEVVKLCHSPELVEQLGKNARELVESKYSWEQLAIKFMKACQRVLSAP